MAINQWVVSRPCLRKFQGTREQGYFLKFGYKGQGQQGHGC